MVMAKKWKKRVRVRCGEKNIVKGKKDEERESNNNGRRYEEENDLSETRAGTGGRGGGSKRTNIKKIENEMDSG